MWRAPAPAPVTPLMKKKNGETDAPIPVKLKAKPINPEIMLIVPNQSAVSCFQFSPVQ
jgi:hypothetical protein